MPKKESEEVIRVHLWLYKSDWEKMKTIYEPTIGPSKAIREIVRNFLRTIEAKVEAVGHKLGGMEL